MLVEVTDHAAERFRQRVGGRRGEVDVKREIATRVADAAAAGRIAPSEREDSPRGTVEVRDLVDRWVVFICRPIDEGTLLVVTLWERDGAPGGPKVPTRFTSALKDTDEAVSDKRRED